MAGLFDKIKKDVKKGIAAVKEGAGVVSEKMGELTTEGKRQYKMYDLKSKIQGQMTVLGGRTYDVLDGKKNPSTDSAVEEIFAKIKKMEAQLHKLEDLKEKKAVASKKPAMKAKAAPKKAAPSAVQKATVNKTAVKTTTKTSTKQ